MKNKKGTEKMQKKHRQIKEMEKKVHLVVDFQMKEKNLKAKLVGQMKEVTKVKHNKIFPPIMYLKIIIY